MWAQNKLQTSPLRWSEGSSPGDKPGWTTSPPRDPFRSDYSPARYLAEGAEFRRQQDYRRRQQGQQWSDFGSIAGPLFVWLLLGMATALLLRYVEDNNGTIKLACAVAMLLFGFRVFYGFQGEQLKAWEMSFWLLLGVATALLLRYFEVDDGTTKFVLLIIMALFGLRTFYAFQGEQLKARLMEKEHKLRDWMREQAELRRQGDEADEAARKQRAVEQEKEWQRQRESEAEERRRQDKMRREERERLRAEGEERQRRHDEEQRQRRLRDEEARQQREADEAARRQDEEEAVRIEEAFKRKEAELKAKANAANSRRKSWRQSTMLSADAAALLPLQHAEVEADEPDEPQKEPEMSSEERRAMLRRQLEEMMRRMGGRIWTIYINDLYPKSMTEEQVLADLLEVFMLLLEYNSQIRMSFRYYLSHGMYKTDKRFFGMNLTQFTIFVKDLGIIDSNMRIQAQLGLIFKTVNSSRDKTTGHIVKGKEGSPEAEMMLAEFAECLVRLARAIRPKSALSAALRLFFTKSFLARARVFEIDDLRSTLLSSQEVLAVFARHDDGLRRCFGSKTSMNISDYFHLMFKGDLVNRDLTIPKLCTIFMLANFQEEDVLGWNDWEWEMQWTEFEDALLRVSLLQLTSKNGDDALVRMDREAIAEHLEAFLRSFLSALGRKQ